MTETRYVDVFKDGKLIKQEPYEVSDAELAEEAEAGEIEQIKDTLDSITTAAQAITVLKKLVKRLVKKGILP